MTTYTITKELVLHAQPDESNKFIISSSSEDATINPAYHTVNEFVFDSTVRPEYLSFEKHGDTLKILNRDTSKFYEFVNFFNNPEAPYSKYVISFEATGQVILLGSSQADGTLETSINYDVLENSPTIESLLEMNILETVTAHDVSLGYYNDYIKTGDQSVTVDAGGGSNIVITGAGDDTINVTGNDYINAGDGNNTINAQSGSYSVIAYDTNSANTIINNQNYGNYSIYFGDGLNKDTLVFNYEGNDLIISNTISNSTIRLTDFNDGYNYQGYSFIVQDELGKSYSLSEFMTKFSTIVASEGDTSFTAQKDETINYTGNDLNNTVTGSIGNDTIDGGAGDDVINGLGGSNTLIGGDGNDTLILNSVNDYAVGGTGNDTYDLTKFQGGEGLPTTVEASDEGVDTLIVNKALYYLSDNIENVTGVGESVDYIGGNELNNTLVALDGNVSFDGLGGDDTLIGGAGDNAFFGGSGNNTIYGGGGNDTFWLDLTDTAYSSNTIYSSNGSGVSNINISGVADIAELKIYKQNDDLVILQKSINEVVATIKDYYTVGSNIQTIGVYDYFNPQPQYNLADLIVPSVATEVKYGTAAADKMTVTSDVAAEYYGLAGNDILTGGKNDDYLDGGDGTDTLIGGLGNNTLVGGLGNDTYVVSSSTDKIIENLAAGTDTVKSSVDLTLASNVENLTLMAADLTGTGNELANTLTAHSSGSTLFGLDGVDKLVGGAGNDYLDGGNGNDTLTSGAGDNSLVGGAGNDIVTGGAGVNTLIGGAGLDTLTGGTGTNAMYGGLDNDTYVVLNSKDTANENLGEGTDTVKSSVSFTLGANIENLTMMAASLVGNGNELVNTLTAHASGSTLYGFAGNDKLNGGDGNDYLDGGGGNDTITGGAGVNTLIGGAGLDVLTGGAGTNAMYGGLDNDTYTVVSSTDTVIENLNEGIDLVKSSVDFTLASNVENLTMGLAGLTGTGNELANTLTAHVGGSTLLGLDGVDRLVGGAGNDYLDGGSGNDTITGGNGLNTLIGGAGNDTITGGTGSDIITGGTGNDVLTGGVGSDVYRFSLGDGQDTINNTTIDTTVGRMDQLVFNQGINADQLWFQKSGNNLVISVLNTTDKVTVTNWFTSNNNHIQDIVSGDGQHLSDAHVDQLVQLTGIQAQPVDGHITGPALDVWGF